MAKPKEDMRAAYPYRPPTFDNGDIPGMTLRQYAAIQIMVGLAAHDGFPENKAGRAVRAADDLLAELDRTAAEDAEP